MRRIWSIDSTRIVAALFVVVIHTTPFGGVGTAGNAVHFVLDSMARFAVPFFFLTAGYLLARKRREEGRTGYTRRYLGSVLGLYVFGLVVNVPAKLVFAAGQAAKHGEAIPTRLLSELGIALHPLNVLYYGDGAATPLWFLPALFYAVVFVTLLRRVGLGQYVLPLALALHVVGFFGQGLDTFFSVSVETRDALFFGFFFTAAGFELGGRGTAVNERYQPVYLALFLSLSVLRLVEVYVMGYVLGDSPFGGLADGVYVVDYSPVTALVALSLFLYLLSSPRLGEKTPLPQLGEHAVGVYVVHPAMILLLRDIAARSVELVSGVAIVGTLHWHLFFTPAVIVSSVVAYVLLERAGVRRRIADAVNGVFVRARRGDRTVS